MILPREIALKGGACAIAVATPKAPLTVILRGNRMPGARKTAGQLLQLARVRTRIGQAARRCRLATGLRRPPRPEACFL